mgnify:CR=1 FL=1
MIRKILDPYGVSSIREDLLWKKLYFIPFIYCPSYIGVFLEKNILPVGKPDIKYLMKVLPTGSIKLKKFIFLLMVHPLL